MTSVPPWMDLLIALLLLGGAMAFVLHRSLNSQLLNPNAQELRADIHTQALRLIQHQHLGELDNALSESRLSLSQYVSARDELMHQVLQEQLREGKTSRVFTERPLQCETQKVAMQPTGPVRWVWIVLLLSVLSALSYMQLGASQTWWTPPLSQRVHISVSTPQQLQEQTRVWQQVTQEKAQDAEAWLTLARLQAAQNLYGPAEQSLSRAVALSPESDLWIERAQMKALSVGGIYTGEPWQWIHAVLKQEPQHLNALVLAGSAAMSEHQIETASAYWQRALSLVPEQSEAAEDLRQALANVRQKSVSAEHSFQASDPLDAQSKGIDSDVIQGEVRISPELKKRIGSDVTLFIYALAEEGSRRPVAIWRGVPNTWPVSFTLNDSMGMGTSPTLSSLAKVRLVARLSKTGTAQKQSDDYEVQRVGVKVGSKGLVLNLSGQ